MTEENVKQEKPLSLSIGQQLRTAREAQHLSIEDVSRQLLLSKQLINDIENDDYSKIAAPVYIRGYLRAYAQLLKIEVPNLPKSIKPAAQIAVRTGGKVNTNAPMAHKSNILGYVVVAVLVLLVLLWWHATRGPQDVAIIPADAAEEVKAPLPQPAVTTSVLPSSPNVSVTAVPNAAASVNANTAVIPSATPENKFSSETTKSQ